MIWVNGSEGLLGRYVKWILRPFSQAICTTYEGFDITDTERVNKFIQETPFSAIVHCAALTDVDWCESHYEETMNVNAHAVENICENIPEETVFILLSTDYAGTMNNYGLSKQMAENIVAKRKNHYIIRTSSLYGCGRPNFGTQLWAAGKKLIHPVKVVDDMKCSPTYAYHVAQAIKTLIDFKPPFGTYNYVDQGITSRYDFAKSLFEFMDVQEPYPFQKIGLKLLQLSAQRPSDVLLDCSMSTVIGLQSSEDGITRFMSEMREWAQGNKTYGD